MIYFCKNEAGIVVFPLKCYISDMLCIFLFHNYAQLHVSSLVFVSVKIQNKNIQESYNKLKLVLVIFCTAV